MEYIKHELADVDGIYVVNHIHLNGKEYLVAGSEKEDGILLYDCANESIRHIADHPGGHMSIISLPSEYGIGLLAIGEFKPVFQSENAGIYLYTPSSSLVHQWNCHRIIDLPFVHRIEILESNSEHWLIASTLCKGKDFTDDWSKPGTVYAARIPTTPQNTASWQLTEVLKGGIHKNHGMHVNDLYGNGKPGVLISGQEGIFHLSPPAAFAKDWQIEQLLDHEVSDIYIFDLDDDKQKELITIEPFHGNICAVYKKITQKWERSLVNKNASMGHALWAGKFNGKNTILFGWREKEAKLELYRPNSQWPFSFESTVIDSGIAPTQVSCFKHKNRDAIATAAHKPGKINIYR